MISRACVAMVALLACPTDPVFAYEASTHAIISAVSVQQSVLQDPNTLKRLGLQPPPPDGSNAAPQKFNEWRDTASVFTLASIPDLISFGAFWEDERSLIQGVRHFYDPVLDRPLSSPDGSVYPFALKSPDWILEDHTDYSTTLPAPQLFSYKKARNAFFKALTGYQEQNPLRTPDDYWGLTFQSLGHVIHHLQDMAQPQHTRSDAHCDADACKWMADNLAGGSTQLYNPSGYEKYTQRSDSNLPYLLPSGSSYPPVYPGPNPSLRVFKLPRDFWRTTTPGSPIDNGNGISEFTNRSFFSAGTITNQNTPQQLDVWTPDGFGGFQWSTITVYGSYASPAVPVDLNSWSEQVDNQALNPASPLSGTLFFFSSPVHDELLGTNDTNLRAVTYSIFDGSLQTYAPGSKPVFALNDYNYREQNRFLIPRAVGYSAGLINYFFRGNLDIQPPDEGVYGIVDTALCPGICVFTRIKLKLMNITAPTEIMGKGKLWAVAKYRLNGCYLNDLSGEDGGNHFPCAAGRSQTDGYSLSQPVDVASVQSANYDRVTFDFSASPIPVNASDLVLRVVFQGQLGDEAGAIATATKDIVEPNFLAVANITDYAFSVTGDQRYHQVDGLPANTREVISSIQFGFADLATNPPIATLTALQAAQHAQFAFLADTGVHYWLHTVASESYPSEDNVALDLDTFVLDDTQNPPVYERTCPVTSERGIYREFFRYYAQAVHGVGSQGSPGGLKVGHGLGGSGVILKHASDCYTPPDPGTGGLDDLSYLLPPFTPATASPWTINFPP